MNKKCLTLKSYLQAYAYSDCPVVSLPPVERPYDAVCYPVIVRLMRAIVNLRMQILLWRVQYEEVQDDLTD